MRRLQQELQTEASAAGTAAPVQLQGVLKSLFDSHKIKKVLTKKTHTMKTTIFI